MATGGFKAFEHVFTGTNYTSYSSYSTGETAVKALLKAVTQGIVATEPHWTYDSNFTSTADNFVKIGSSSSKWYDACFAQFLINTNTGSKLLVYYNPGTTTVVDLSSVLRYNNTTGYCIFGYGLCMAMIPGGSSQTWDTTSNCTTSSFLPTQATPILGTSSKPDLGSTTATNANFVGTSGTHRYVIVIKEDVILVFWQDSNSGNMCGCNAVGKIFGTLCNASDDGVCSQYGCITFKKYTMTQTGYAESDYSNSMLNSRGLPLIYVASGTNVYCLNQQMFMSYFKIDTTSKPTSTSNSGARSISASNQMAFYDGAAQSSTTNKTAFTPFLVGGENVGSDSYFKGYLDTDVFRGVYPGFPYNTLFDNGKFIYVGSGLAVGWDASNTVILRT